MWWNCVYFYSCFDQENTEIASLHYYVQSGALFVSQHFSVPKIHRFLGLLKILIQKYLYEPYRLVPEKSGFQKAGFQQNKIVLGAMKDNALLFRIGAEPGKFSSFFSETVNPNELNFFLQILWTNSGVAYFSFSKMLLLWNLVASGRQALVLVYQGYLPYFASPNIFDRYLSKQKKATPWLSLSTSWRWSRGLLHVSKLLFSSSRCVYPERGVPSREKSLDKGYS